MRLVWTEPAKLAILPRAWIAHERPSAAASQVQRIVNTVAGLREFPSIGRPGRRGGVRELVVTGSPFIFADKVRDDEIEIPRVFHGARRWPDSL
jgi:toxin ParE1/3/4